MTLIVEDGTSKSTAESYISVADTDTYYSDRGNTTWGVLTTTQKEQALRRATDYMSSQYRIRWSGRRTTPTQALDWPRKWVYLYDVSACVPLDHDIVPIEVQRACAELALRASAADLLQDQEQKIVEETVGPITTKWDPISFQGTRYVFVDNMIGMYMLNNGSPIVARLVRC